MVTEREQLALRVADVGLVGRRIDASLVHVAVEYTVYNQVGVAPNRRGEVGVVGLGETVVAISAGAVLRLLETA